MYIKADIGQMNRVISAMSDGQKRMRVMQEQVAALNQQLKVAEEMPGITRLLDKQIAELDKNVSDLRIMREALESIIEVYDDSEYGVIQHLEEVKQEGSFNEVFGEVTIPEWITNIVYM